MVFMQQNTNAEFILICRFSVYVKPMRKSIKLPIVCVYQTEILLLFIISKTTIFTIKPTALLLSNKIKVINVNIKITYDHYTYKKKKTDRNLTVLILRSIFLSYLNTEKLINKKYIFMF